MELQELFREENRIESDAVVLQAVGLEDAESLLPMYSDSSIYRYRPGLPRTTLPLVRKVIKRFCEDREQGKTAAFTVFDRTDGMKAVGLVEVFHVDARVEQVEIGYTVAPAFQGRGIAVAAVGCITDYLIWHVGFNRIYASVHKDNEGSVKVLRKNGFTYEGTVRQGEFWQGIGFVDVCRFSKLRMDYEKPGQGL